MTWLTSAVLVLLLCVSLALPAAAQGAVGPDRLEAALQAIDRVCRSVPLTGSETDVTVKGDAEARLKGLASRLAQAGVRLDGTASIKQYENVLREHLGGVFQTVTTCRQRTFELVYLSLDPAQGGPSEKKATGARKATDVTGSWSGTVTCPDGRSWVGYLSVNDAAGAGWWKWRGVNSGRAQSSLTRNAIDDDGGYTLVPGQGGVYSYDLRMSGPDRLEGMSRGPERCSIRLSRI